MVASRSFESIVGEVGRDMVSGPRVKRGGKSKAKEDASNAYLVAYPSSGNPALCLLTRFAQVLAALVEKCAQSLLCVRENDHHWFRSLDRRHEYNCTMGYERQAEVSCKKTSTILEKDSLHAPARPGERVRVRVNGERL